VTVPARWSDSGKQKDRYFETKKDAEKFIADTLSEKREHGKQSVTAEERHWIHAARLELGDLSRLREVLDHWRKTAHGVTSVLVNDAVESFIEFRTKQTKLNAETKRDVTWRLRAFAKAFGSESLHGITPGQIETYLAAHSEGWSRKSHHKRLLQFFSHAKRHRWIALNPFDELQPPDTPGGKREVYTPNQFRVLMLQAVVTDTEVALYIALAGLAFCRSQELVRRVGNEAVLEWSDVLWDRKQLHIRPEVAKSTRRKSGNERFTPIHETLLQWLRPLSKGRSGRVITASVRSFRKRLQKVFKKAEVVFIDNGLRHSAISYWLAGHPEFGVAQVSQWAGNSEHSCRMHYLKILTQQDGLEWFEKIEWLTEMSPEWVTPEAPKFEVAGHSHDKRETHRKSE
jgi:hypothetical protein